MSKPSFYVGEYWSSLAYGDGRLKENQIFHRRQLLNWVRSAGLYATAFDCTTKGILQSSVQGELWRLKDQAGKRPGLIGIAPERAVTFVENHDTGSTQNLWPFPFEKIMQGYAYILTHPGIPSMVYLCINQFH